MKVGNAPISQKVFVRIPPNFAEKYNGKQVYNLLKKLENQIVPRNSKII